MSSRTEKLIIVLTGGPSGGKTTLIEALQKDVTSSVSIVPEAASILYRGGFPRRGSIEGRKHVQRAIYFTQRELEDLVLKESKHKTLVCDRGSLDSVAYWPGTEEELFHSLDSNKQRELSRYDWVLHLDTAPSESFDDQNPIRTEDHREALAINHKIKLAWEGHPNRIIIPHEHDFLAKIAKAKSVILAIQKGLDRQAIEQSLL